MKHLLKLADLSTEEIFGILNLADQLKYERKNGIPHPHLAGKKLGMIFTKSSTRTRVSFEVGMTELGGTALFLSDRDIQLGRGEPIKDTVRVLSRYLDAIMIRTFAQQDVEDLAKYGSIPIINGLTDYCHPCQVLADLMTIREYKGSLKGLKLCFVGDGNNMANSLIVGGIKTGMEVSIASDLKKAAEGADVLYTDVWASMGQEGEKAVREKVFKNYCVDADLLSVAKSDAMVLHCLPAHRGEEITDEVFEAHANEIFDEAENRLHAQKAVLCKVLK